MKFRQSSSQKQPAIFSVDVILYYICCDHFDNRCSRRAPINLYNTIILCCIHVEFQRFAYSQNLIRRLSLRSNSIRFQIMLLHRKYIAL